MEDVGWIHHVTPYPLGDVLAKAAAHSRLVTNPVGFTEPTQARLGPVANWHHDGSLMHLEV
ncbi:MAG: hypothetical protein AAB393_09670, partial [Bacteroidota bacterium]